MKSVLISIKPKWVNLIAEGKKTVEVRKTKPKIDVPFKCYIYCTKGREILGWHSEYKDNTRDNEHEYKVFTLHGQDKNAFNGKVIGEFVCDRIVDIPYSQYFVDYYHTMPQDDLEATCLCMGHIDEYLLSKDGYGWHITNLVIYDKPKELGEFKHECNKVCVDTKNKIKCERISIDGFSCNGLKPITSPPQSYMLVEELGV